MNEVRTEKKQKTLIVRTAREISLDTLRQVLAHSNLQWAYAERMADTGLGTIADLLEGEPLGSPKDGNRPGVGLERWEHGRAFGPDLEIDWWREGETFRLRGLSESALPEEITWTEPNGSSPPTVVGTLRVMTLYGIHDKASSPERPTWSEARVPRYLAYPIQCDDQPPQRVTLLGQDYARRGVVVMTRLVGVVPWDKNKIKPKKEKK